MKIKLEQMEQINLTIDEYIDDFIRIEGNYNGYFTERYLIVNYIVIVCEEFRRLLNEKKHLEIEEYVHKYIEDLTLISENKKRLKNYVIVVKNGIKIMHLNMKERILEKCSCEIKSRRFEFINNNSENEYGTLTMYIDLREFYKESDYFPTIDFIFENIKNRIIGVRKIYIVLPIFLTTKSLIFDSMNHGYHKVYYEYERYYQKLFDRLSKLDVETYFIISNFMRYKDFKMWSSSIKKQFLKDQIKIGIMIEDYDVVYDFEDDNIDLYIIDYDSVLEDFSDKKCISYQEFKENFENLYRDVHLYVKEKKRCLVVKTTELNNEKIIEKLFIMGFKSFIYDNKNNQYIINSINNYMSRRGKYSTKTIKEKEGLAI
ncbi:hypothetical protein [Haploplasma axanthum]|uniref:Uncharacterized protein n=1 Tax=Haploplasma axanthum TaxID=29552 RepID=A0A449BCC9_HAPAX|nr:hypothetical protein [Haploplasma axanthum]VEU80088.1 Uncharacterised protein [Haploplasma axanthum]